MKDFLVTNDNLNILEYIDEGIKNSNRIWFIVSFMKITGWRLIQEQIEDALNRGVYIKFITSTYLNITDGNVLHLFSALRNQYPGRFDYRVIKSNVGYHMKAYIFKNDNNSLCIVGSSNMTSGGLQENVEWNIVKKIPSNDRFLVETLQKFNNLWESRVAKKMTEKEIDNYMNVRGEEGKYNEVFNSFSIFHSSCDKNTIEMRETQEKALIQMLNDYFEKKRRKGILVLATGVGKTHTIAFFCKLLNLKKILFVTPRVEIMEKAKSIFQQVWEKNISFENTDLSYLIKTKYKKYNLQDNLKSREKETYQNDFYLLNDKNVKNFDLLDIQNKKLFVVYNSLHNFLKKNRTCEPFFDILIIDEAHHTLENESKGKENHLKMIENIIKTIKRDITLGLTATDFRTDAKETIKLQEIYNPNIDGIDWCIYRLNVLDAIKAFALCPFHYYSITVKNLIFNDKEMKNNNIVFKHYIRRVSAKSIWKTINRYSYSADKLRCLVFCVNKEHARQICDDLNEVEEDSALLVISNEKEDNRLKAEIALEKFNSKTKFIVSVNIYNEGIDIPCINTIIFLRPTKSLLVFLQQLGRGLRIDESKELLTVFDFVRNAKDVRLKLISELQNQYGEMNKQLFESLPSSLNDSHRNKTFFVQYDDSEQQFEKINMDREWFNTLFKDLNKPITKLKSLMNKKNWINQQVKNITIANALDYFSYEELLVLKHNNKGKLFEEIFENIELSKSSELKLLNVIQNKHFRFISDFYILKEAIKTNFNSINVSTMNTYLNLGDRKWKEFMRNFCLYLLDDELCHFDEINNEIVFPLFGSKGIGKEFYGFFKNTFSFHKRVFETYYGANIQKERGNAFIKEKLYKRTDCEFINSFRQAGNTRNWSLINKENKSACVLVGGSNPYDYSFISRNIIKCYTMTKNFNQEFEQLDRLDSVNWFIRLDNISDLNRHYYYLGTSKKIIQKNESKNGMPHYWYLIYLKDSLSKNFFKLINLILYNYKKNK